MSTFIMNTGWLGAGLMVGYAACIFTWPKVKVFVNGAEVEAQALRDKARAMIKGLK